MQRENRNLMKINGLVVVKFEDQNFRYILPYNVANAIFKTINSYDTAYNVKGGVMLKYHAIYSIEEELDDFLKASNVKRLLAIFYDMNAYFMYCENKHKPTHIKYDCNNNPYNLPSITLNILEKERQNCWQNNNNIVLYNREEGGVWLIV